MVRRLDVLAWIAYDVGRSERAATLLGVTAQLARAMGALPSFFPELAAHHERYAQRARDALGEQAYRAAFTRGERLFLDEAVAYALNQPLPPPATPPSAAVSTPLTRRELQVAEALSDRDIAAKLVISRRTAESHAQNITTKLGLRNRAQLAAWVTAQR